MMAQPEPGDFLPRLKDDLIHRRIHSGLSLLNSRRSELETFDPAEDGAATLLGYVAQWVDIGFADAGLVRKMLAGFEPVSRARMRLGDYVHLRMAEGLVAMAEGEFATAIGHCEFVSSFEGEIEDTELLAIANFWIGRCLRRDGRYDDALTYTARASRIARESGYERIAAVIQILESWLVFQKGRIPEASAILAQAEGVLAETDDWIPLGNIQSAHGRIARREGKYERALERFERGICLFKRRDPCHRNLARSLSNMAFVKRLIAVRLERNVNREAARRKRSGTREAAPPATAQARVRIERLRSEALAELDEAFRIYSVTNDHHGLGGVRVHRGFLMLDAGDLDDAGTEAEAAYHLGEERKDHILMARARLLQCRVENAKFEEQIEGTAEPGLHAQRADEYARDAVELARQTQNPRLLARAYVWQGMTFANDFFDNAEAARRCCDSATALVRPEGDDNLWDDLQELRTKVLKRGRVDSVLREWSEGLVGAKTFQQISEEFAAILIPKVWEREGRRVSRVAAKLSISPKKVRRILQSQGLLYFGDRLRNP